jgi:hypothetical protein
MQLFLCEGFAGEAGEQSHESRVISGAVLQLALLGAVSRPSIAVKCS